MPDNEVRDDEAQACIAAVLAIREQRRAEGQPLRGALFEAAAAIMARIDARKLNS
jgi:hypothetical protein